MDGPGAGAPQLLMKPGCKTNHRPQTKIVAEEPLPDISCYFGHIHSKDPRILLERGLLGPLYLLRALNFMARPSYLSPSRRSVSSHASTISCITLLQTYVVIQKVHDRLAFPVFFCSIARRSEGMSPERRTESIAEQTCGSSAQLSVRRGRGVRKRP